MASDEYQNAIYDMLRLLSGHLRTVNVNAVLELDSDGPGEWCSLVESLSIQISSLHTIAGEVSRRVKDHGYSFQEPTS